MRDQSRRKLLKNVTGMSAAIAFSGRARAQSSGPEARVLGANDRIRIGLIGCGNRGRGDLRVFLRTGKVDCVALCDVDPSHMQEAIDKDLAPVSQKPDLMTQDFRRVVERLDIDAVIVATPDHWHALPTVMACQAGKDVYVEKPLAVSIGEGRVMVDVARKHKRVVQMGTQQRSASHFRKAVEYVRSGKLGKIRLVRAWAYLDWVGELPPVPDGDPPPGVDYDLWLGPAPRRPFNENRFHFSFRWFWDYSGGLMTDWGAHMIDVANWAMGIRAPSSAMAVGGKFGYPHDAMETPDTMQVLWQFPDFSMVWEHALGIGKGPEQREHGVEFHGNDGVLVVDRGGWEVYPETDRIDKPAREYRSAGLPRQGGGDEDYHLRHVMNFLECMRNRSQPRSDVEIGHNSMIACHLGNIALRLGRRVSWDVEAERMAGDEEAQSYVMRPYRSPWTLTV